jgi:hypothetical protein
MTRISPDEWACTNPECSRTAAADTCCSACGSDSYSALQADEAVDDGDTDEDVDDDHACEHCGDKFENAAGRAKHEKHCDENPGAESVEGTPSRNGALTDAQRETVETIVEREITEIDELADELGLKYSTAIGRLGYLRSDGYEIHSPSLLDDARRILDEVDEQVEDDADEDGQDEGESDDVEMQDVPTDRDIEQGREAAEDVLDGEGEGTPHVKNEEPETFATEMRPAEAFQIIRDLDDPMLARGIYREVLDAAREGEI